MKFSTIALLRSGAVKLSAADPPAGAFKGALTERQPPVDLGVAENGPDSITRKQPAIGFKRSTIESPLEKIPAAPCFDRRMPIPRRQPCLRTCAAVAASRCYHPQPGSPA
jgi:hypothetical protein